jgi:alkanesulfonate monooxygenase SsuD/methylene tetrahydromethanopterin reductase-like flavin-dependent oxidoreductase (luciferase family)
VATGGYRDAFEGVAPDLADASRAQLMTEGIDALRLLFEQPQSTYDGKYRRFRDVESYPKPVHSPLPSPEGMPRARSDGPGSVARAGFLPSWVRPK